jgi:DNA-binding PadR family transcriptional regulator
MYELFVLSLLMEQPLHGYRLHSIISTALGPLRQMSWGALYPLIRRLETDGYIEPQEDAEGRGERRRKVYRITDAGRHRFLELMMEPGQFDTDYEDLFTIKLISFGRVPPREQRAVLEQYRDYVRHLIHYVEAGQRHVASHPPIPVRQRPYILRAMEHRLYLLRADLHWIDEEIRRHAVAGTELEAAMDGARAQLTVFKQTMTTAERKPLEGEGTRKGNGKE